MPMGPDAPMVMGIAMVTERPMGAIVSMIAPVDIVGYHIAQAADGDNGAHIATMQMMIAIVNMSVRDIQIECRVLYYGVAKILKLLLPSSQH